MYIRPTSKFVNQHERRWTRVVQLCSTQGAIPSPPADDQYVMDAFRFLTAMNEAAGNEARQAKVSHRYPSLYEAYTLKKAANPTTRSAVEALIVGHVDIAVIAREYDVSPEVITWYKKLWFDVGEKPLSRLQVTTVLVPELHGSGMSADNVDALAKLMATSFSPDHALDFLELRELRDGDFSKHQNMYRTLLMYKATRAVACVPVNSFTALPLMETQLQIERMDKEMSLAQGASGGTQSEVMDMMLKGAASAWVVMNKGDIPSDVNGKLRLAETSSNLAQLGSGS
jgi:hypothetical protein